MATTITSESVKQITYLAGRVESTPHHRGRDPPRRPGPRRRAGPTRTTSLRSSNGKCPPGTRPGRDLRIKAAGFAARKTIEDFDWDAQPAIRQQVGALASGGFLTEARNVVLLGPPGTGKTHLATALGIVAARHGHRVLFATATDWVTRLTDAHRQGRLPAELGRLRRYGLIIVDEVGYLPFEQDAANLFFQLVSSSLRTRVADPHLEPAVLRLGRRLRRPSRRRRDDRPHRPPRRRPHPERRLLPAPRTRHRQPPQHQNPRTGKLETTTGGPIFGRRIGLKFERRRHESPGIPQWWCPGTADVASVAQMVDKLPPVASVEDWSGMCAAQKFRLNLGSTRNMARTQVEPDFSRAATPARRGCHSSPYAGTVRIDIVTIFPEFFSVLDVSLLGKARQAGLLELGVHDLRDFTHDRHRTVDDTPYGGGAGMVMKPEPWGEAFDSILGCGPTQAPTIRASSRHPAGERVQPGDRTRTVPAPAAPGLRMRALRGNRPARHRLRGDARRRCARSASATTC